MRPVSQVDTLQLIAIFGSVFRNSVNPSKFGVVLTYTLAAASFLANLVSLYAQVEQEMVCRNFQSLK